jgi:predicted HAD superfamily phosphohydrolase
MKNILAIIVLFCATVSVAQKTTPRFGTTKNDDNTGRVLTYAIVTTTDLAQATLDTITLVPSAYETLVCMKTGTAITNLSDSVCYKFSSTEVNKNRVGDRVTFMISKGTGAGKIKFGGSVYILSTASAAVALAANKSLIMSFIWNGSKWIECERVVQP